MFGAAAQVDVSRREEKGNEGEDSGDAGADVLPVSGFKGFTFSGEDSTPAPRRGRVRGFLNFAWGPSDDLILFASRPKPHVSREAATKAAGQPSSDSSNAGTAKVAPMVQTFRQHFAPVRKLMHQSHAVFQDLQTRVRTCPRRSEQLRLRLLAASRRYRGQYDACIGDMDDDLDDDLSPEQESEVYSMRVSSAVFHFCEIAFLACPRRFGGGATSSGGNDNVAGLVGSWLQDHFLQSILDGAMSTDGDQLWLLVFDAVLRGQPEEAASLLASHHPAVAAFVHRRMQASDTSTVRPLVKVYRLLKSYPRYRPAAGQSQMDYELRWSEWHQEVEDVRKLCEMRSRGGAGAGGHTAAGMSLEDEALETEATEAIASIMAGDFESDKCRLRVVQNGEWYHELHTHWDKLMQARLLFSEPVTRRRRSDLKRLLARCHADAGATVPAADGGEDAVQQATLNTQILNCLLSALEGDPSLALLLVIQAGQPWAAAHLADLLWHHEVLNLKDTFGGWGVGFRDHLLLEYATLLRSYRPMWRLACSYANAAVCPSGKELAKLTAERVAATTDRAAHQVAHLYSSTFHNPEGATTVFKVRGMEWLRRRQYGQALAWYLRAHGAGSVGVRAVAHRLLEALQSVRTLQLRRSENHAAAGSSPTDIPESLVAAAEEAAELVDGALLAVPSESALLTSPMLLFVARYRQWQLVIDDLHAALDAAPSATANAGDHAANHAAANAAFLRREAARRLHDLVCGVVVCGVPGEHLRRPGQRRLLGVDEAQGGAELPDVEVAAIAAHATDRASRATDAFAPPAARVSLLLDAAKHQLLARQPSCFTTKEAHELVTCFQDLSTAHNGGDAYLSAATPQQLHDLAALLAETLASSVLDAASVVPAAVPAWKTRTNAASPTPEAEYGLELAADSEAAAAPAPSLFAPGPRPGRRVGNTPDVSMDDDDI